MLLPACVTHEEVVNLAEIEHMHMLVGVSTQRVRVELEYGGHPCVLFADDISAEVRTETQSIPITILGGGEDESAETGECFPFRIHLDSPPAADPASFVLADSSGEISVDLGGFLLPATASLVPAGPWNLASNQTYTVALSQRAAFVPSSSSSVKLIIPAEATRTLSSRIVGDTVVFTTPADLPTSGQAMLSMMVSGPQYTDWECPPSSWNCDLVIDRTPVTQPITFVP